MPAYMMDVYSVASYGVCIISGASSSIPVFSVNFSALPFCFMYLHSSLHIRFVGLLHIHVMNSASIHDDDKEITGNKKFLPLPSIPLEKDQAECEIVASRNDHSDTMRVLHQTFGVFKLKNGRSIQKRRSSLRSKRSRPPSNFRMQKGKGALPIPRVCEVEGYGDGDTVPFVRPDFYIAVRDDELTRALVKGTANYDKDSDDEEWVNKFNSGSCGESDPCEYLSAERFELMIDAFKKAIHCNPDGIFKEEAAYSTCPDLERRVVEAVYSYWSKRRKQNRSALIRIFQCYQPRKTQLFARKSHLNDREAEKLN